MWALPPSVVLLRCYLYRLWCTRGDGAEFARFSLHGSHASRLSAEPLGLAFTPGQGPSGSTGTWGANIFTQIYLPWTKYIRLGPNIFAQTQIKSHSGPNIFTRDQIYLPLQRADAGSLDQNNLPPGAKQVPGYPDPYQNRSRA